MPVYAIVVAKGGGPNLKAGVTVSARTPDKELTEDYYVGDKHSRTFRGNGITTMVVDEGSEREKVYTTRNGSRHLSAPKMSLDVLAKVLSNGLLDWPVLNMTGLQGQYQIELDLPTQSDPSGAVTFASLQKLGLKLESQKAPIEVLRVTHAESPTPNSYVR